MKSISLLALLLSAGVVAATAGVAAAATPSVSANWSGYVVTSPNVTPQAAGFSNVSGSWVQPRARCVTGGTGSSSSAAFWVGLGGNSGQSSGLEQIGTESDCSATGQASYSAWYELVPAPSVNVPLVVRPGDTISASVTVVGSKVTVEMTDATSGQSFLRTRTMANPDTSSADWIAEAPSLCPTASQCTESALTNFGTVRFSNASVTSASYTGTIADAGWTPTEIQLDSAEAAGAGAGGFATQRTAAQALPSALRNGGTAFTVTWRRGAVQQPTPGYGGYGYGNGGYGYRPLAR